MQSQSPNDQYLYACVGLDAIPESKVPQALRKNGFRKNKRKNEKKLLSQYAPQKWVPQKKSAKKYFSSCFKCCRKILLK